MDNKHKNYFSSKYPIICAGMNTVSDVKLALAIREAGCYPSFVAFNHGNILNDEFVYDPSIMLRDLKEFIDRAGDSNFILGLTTDLLALDQKTIDAVYELKPAYIEFLDYMYFNNPKFIEVISNLKLLGTKILIKSISYEIVIRFSKMPNNIIDGVIIKGDKAAGRVSTFPIDLLETVRKIKNLKPNWIIIAQGGIYNSSGIKQYLEAGADAVSLGTMFAAAEESAISEETKNRMINASYSDTSKIGTANQNGIIFSKIKNDEENNTIGLKKGILTGKEGHVFAGAALDHIAQIRPVSNIVQDLIIGL